MDKTPEITPTFFHLWAKSESSQAPDVHPLIYHLVDVGECTLSLWNFALSEQTKRTFAGYLSLDLVEAGRQLAFWASLHDLGKAAPGFQRKYEPRISLLEKAGFIFPRDTSLNPSPHGVLSAWALRELFQQETSMSKRDANMVALALGGHHGAWPTPDRFLPVNLKLSDKGDKPWIEARKHLFRVLSELYHPTISVKLPGVQDDLNSFLALFSGLVSVADWIGSMSENFPFCDEYLPVEEYAKRSAELAKASLEKIGWLGWKADGSLLTFAAMFPSIMTPNNIQQIACEVAEECRLPALAILEAPTGIGKTEAALFLADNWLQREKGSGMYIAMPTQATSNQMYSRVVNFLSNRYPTYSIYAQRFHGAALFEGEDIPRLKGIAQDDKPLEGIVRATTWFLPRKRTLLAPFGVGTVDQAFLSVLQTRHFFVRMFGLGQKVVIFDEVHAYDTYMSTLFERLLRWLHSIGTSVILLSASLPEITRLAFVNAWLGLEEVHIPTAVYPRLTICSVGKVKTIPLPAPHPRTININWIDLSMSQVEDERAGDRQVADHLSEILKDGGCAAVICNRVRHAQDLYKAVKERGIVENKNLILFHARFPFEWRKEIEERVLSLFSKEGVRPYKAVVIATQVIEQSLDLDFDLMLTDLAPVDLLIQRAGRLHRHIKNDANRPQKLKNSCLEIILPQMRGDLPDFGLDARVYDKATLLRTWMTIKGKKQLVLPEETTSLIEAVYGGAVHETEMLPVYIQALYEAEEDARLSHERQIYKAKTRLVASPNDEELIGNRNENLEEEDPRIGEAFRALTRDAEPGVLLVCLHETPSGIALEPDGAGAPLDINHTPDLKEARELLKRSVSIQRMDVVNYFVKYGKTPATWRDVAAVRYHYPVIFDRKGEAHLEGADFTLKLTRELGLDVLKEA